jgi:uncharacterized protein (DUF302 family)
MDNESAVTSFLIPEPFDRAVKRIRSALAETDLTVSGELDISDRIRRQLYVGFSPCRILFVDAPYLLLEAVVVDRAAAAFLPLHVVVAAQGSNTVVYWVDLAALGPPRLPAKAAPLARLHAQLCRALARVSAPADALAGA